MDHKNQAQRQEAQDFSETSRDNSARVIFQQFPLLTSIVPNSGPPPESKILQCAFGCTQQGQRPVVNEVVCLLLGEAAPRRKRSTCRSWSDSYDKKLRFLWLFLCLPTCWPSKISLHLSQKGNIGFAIVKQLKPSTRKKVMSVELCMSEIILLSCMQSGWL